MFYFSHFDDRRHIGVIENKKVQLIVLPPHDDSRVSEIQGDKRFKFSTNISRAPSLEKAINEVKCESYVKTLSTLASIWSKQKSGTGKTITIQESANQIVKQIISGINTGQVLNSDLTDLIAIQLGIGLRSKELEAEIKKCASLMDENVLCTLNFILMQQPSEWKSEIEKIIDYICRVVAPGLRVHDARGTLVIINSYISSGEITITKDQDEMIQACYNQIKAAASYQSGQLGEGLAKSWQSYAPTNVGFKHRERKKIENEDKNKQAPTKEKENEDE